MKMPTLILGGPSGLVERRPDPQVIRLILKSYDPILLDSSCHQLIESIKSNGDTIKGPVPLPTKRRIYCVLRSPHINKDSREHFEIRTHKRLIDLHLMSENSLRKMRELDLPSGVYLMRKK